MLSDHDQEADVWGDVDDNGLLFREMMAGQNPTEIATPSLAVAAASDPAAV